MKNKRDVIQQREGHLREVLGTVSETLQILNSYLLDAVRDLAGPWQGHELN